MAVSDATRLGYGVTSMTNGRISGEEIEDDLYVIQIEGDFDASLRDMGISATESALADEPRGLLIDVKRCTFLDSTAIAVILGARQRALDAGIGFVLVGHNPTIDRTLELSGLSDEFPVLKDRAEAIAQLSAGSRAKPSGQLGAAAGAGASGLKRTVADRALRGPRLNEI